MDKKFFPLYKRMMIGNAIVASGIFFAVITTLLYGWVITQYPQHVDRFNWIFIIGGVILGASTIVSALIIYTNNFGDGFTIRR